MSEYLTERCEFSSNKMPNPTKEDLIDQEFEVIWSVIKSWDLNVPEYYGGYCGANGSHVMLILNKLRAIRVQPN